MSRRNQVTAAVVVVIVALMFTRNVNINVEVDADQATAVAEEQTSQPPLAGREAFRASDSFWMQEFPINGGTCTVEIQDTLGLFFGGIPACVPLYNVTEQPTSSRVALRLTEYKYIQEYPITGGTCVIEVYTPGPSAHFKGIPVCIPHKAP